MKLSDAIAQVATEMASKKYDLELRQARWTYAAIGYAAGLATAVLGLWLQKIGAI